MNNKITIVVASENTKEEKIGFFDMIERTCQYPYELLFFEKNEESLTTIYQNILDNSESDIIIYMHDDIEFLKDGWGKTIVNIFNKNPKFGIVGIAGTRCYGENGQLAWWMSKPEDKRGMLFHSDEGKTWPTIYSDYNPKSDITEVAVIDGVFMAINRDKIEYDFDTDIKGFHFYDIDFCIANLLSRRCKIGVTDRIAVKHNSIGRTNEHWEENKKIILEKYKNNFPLKVFGK